MGYSSSLTDAEWEIIKPLLPQKKQTRPPIWTKRQILDGILYQLKNGCNWGDLPKDFPPYSTVFWHYKQWRSAGVLEQIRDTLHAQVREQVKKNHSGQCWWWSTRKRNTCNAGVESKGFCFYKATNGIKRHLAVDTLGFPFFVHCTKANVSDDQGLIEILTHNIDYFKQRPDDLPKLTILMDNGYHRTHNCARADLSSSYDPDSVWVGSQTDQGSEAGARENRICGRRHSMGHRTLKRLDGAL